MHPAEEHSWKPQHTTPDVLARMVALDENKLFGSGYVDLSKAFDLVNHSILLKRMERYGVRGGEWSGFKLPCWLKADGMCEREEMGMDVPKGSILGLLLYAICVNNLPESVEQHQVKQYADDTAVSICRQCQWIEVVSRASPLLHGGKGLVNRVFKCCPLHTGYCAPIRAQYSVMWDVGRCPQHQFND